MIFVVPLLILAMGFVVTMVAKDSDKLSSLQTVNVIDKSGEGYKGDYTAYSDLVKLDEKRIGILYEKDNYKKIVFTIVKWQ